MARYPAARIGDPVTHDFTVTSGQITFGPTGHCAKNPVYIEGRPAAHVGSGVVCSGATAFGVLPHHMHNGDKADLPGQDFGCVLPPADSAFAKQDRHQIQLQVLSGRMWVASYGFFQAGRLTMTFVVTDAEGNEALYKFSGLGKGFTKGKLPFVNSRTINESPARCYDVPTSITVEYFAELPAEVETIASGSNVVANLYTPDGWGGARMREFEDLPFSVGETERKLPSRGADAMSFRGTVERLVPFIPKSTPNTIVKGSTTVYVHGAPAARWVMSADTALCGAHLGSQPMVASRTVWIGG